MQFKQMTKPKQGLESEHIFTSKIHTEQYIYQDQYLIHMADKLVSIHPSADSTATSILPFIGHLLHVGRNQPMGPQQVPLQTLISKETPLALLAVQRRPTDQHLRMDLDFVYQLHVGAELLEVLYISIADFANDKVASVRRSGAALD